MFFTLVSVSVTNFPDAVIISNFFIFFSFSSFVWMKNMFYLFFYSFVLSLKFWRESFFFYFSYFVLLLLYRIINHELVRWSTFFLDQDVELRVQKDVHICHILILWFLTSHENISQIFNWCLKWLICATTNE